MFIDKKEIIVNEVYWRNMPPEELDRFKQKIFDCYRQPEYGYPYYPTDQEYREKEFQKLKRFDYTSVLSGSGVITQTMHGLGLAWSYFPHAYEVQCANMMSPIVAFNNDAIFKGIIEKRLKMGTYISDSGIRKMIKLYSGVQCVSNFRPTAAAAIYHKYADKGVVWDMSSGWGGRMLGAIIAGVDTYIGTEPSTKTVQGLNELGRDFAGDMKFEIHQCGSEDYDPLPNSLDLCFTSPPYFDLEKYSDEESQSYKKFNNKQAWLDGFLTSTFKNCYKGLKPGKLMLINIADPKSLNLNIESGTVAIAESIGFKQVGRLLLALSNPVMETKKSAFKFEPVFIFKK